MAQAYDLTGMRFGKLIVIKRAENDSHGNTRWLCRCDCGKEHIATCAKLTKGSIKSCGCMRYSQNGHSRSRLYATWRGMRSRCEDPRHTKYRFYGGRGITVCEEWKDFLTFREWALSNGYTDELTIDRIDSDKGYSPDNCRWLTMKEQANNRSSNRLLNYQGKQYTVAQFAEAFHLRYHTVMNRIKAGWSPDKIIHTPEALNDATLLT
ncbi:MAG: hypothetical protein IJ392_02395 [Clostridia bacterium]|nr:hypothetical protein [Clostridia bacterium]